MPKEGRYSMKTQVATILRDQVVTEKDYLDYIKKEKSFDTKNPSTQNTLNQFVSFDTLSDKVAKFLLQAKNIDLPLLFQGEVGTGKTFCAKIFHNLLFPNAEKEIWYLRSGSQEDLEHIKEADLTGEIVKCGLLVLENVHELSKPAQEYIIKLYQLGKNEEYVEGVKPSHLPRLCATTSKNLVDLVHHEKFSRELFFYLSVLDIEVPSLRERKNDLRHFVFQFASESCLEAGKEPVKLAPDSVEKLLAYAWPGNITELKTFIKRLVCTSATNIITVDQIDLAGNNQQFEEEWIKSLPLGRTLHEVETHFILETLKHHNGNRTHAARTLGVSLRTLRNKINEFTGEGFEVCKPLSGKAYDEFD